MNTLTSFNSHFLTFSKGLVANYIGHVDSKNNILDRLIAHESIARIFLQQVGQLTSLAPSAQNAIRFIPLSLTLGSYFLSKQFDPVSKHVARLYQVAILTSTIALLFLGPPQNQALLLAGFMFSYLNHLFPTDIGSNVEWAMFVYLNLYKLVTGNKFEKLYSATQLIPSIDQNKEYPQTPKVPVTKTLLDEMGGDPQKMKTRRCYIREKAADPSSLEGQCKAILANERKEIMKELFPFPIFVNLASWYIYNPDSSEPIIPSDEWPTFRLANWVLWQIHDPIEIIQQKLKTDAPLQALYTQWWASESRTSSESRMSLLAGYHIDNLVDPFFVGAFLLEIGVLEPC